MFLLLSKRRNNLYYLFVVLIAYLICPNVHSFSSNPLGPAKKQSCEHYFEFLKEHNQSTIIKNSSAINFQYVDSSKQCDNELGNDWQNYRQCKEGEISLALYTETILPEGNYLPYIRLNMSAIMMEPASAIWFVYTCINAPDKEDTYCHNKDKQLQRYGANVLPCRGVKLVNSLDSELFRADVLCFRMFGLSQYRIDVVIQPRNCKASLYATLPIDKKFDPRIEQFYASNRENHTLDYNEWSPFTFVETHPEDGVWIRFEYPPPLAQVLEINFALYRQSNDGDSVQFVRDEIVRLPNTGFKWIDLDEGAYKVYAYVKRSNCRLICNENSNISACIVCPHTMINFTIETNKFTSSWGRSRALIAIAKVFAVAVLVLLLIVAVGLVSVFIYLRFIRPKRQLRRPAQNFELVARPKVLILYTDDCQQHSDCVLQLANFLVINASTRVHIDQWDLVDPTVRATNWLVNKLASVDFVVLVFSDGSRRVMEGERMKERRPFPDLFNPALRLVVSKITAIVSRTPTFDPSTRLPQNNNGMSNGTSSENAKESLKKFIVVRFNYTLPQSIAEFFPHMGCGTYKIPEDLPRIVGHLHKLETNQNSLLEFTTDNAQLNEAIQSFVQFRSQNPNYLEERFSTEMPNQEGVDQLTGLSLANPELPEHIVRSDQETLQLIEKYGLVNGEIEENGDIANANQANGVNANNSHFDRRLEEQFPLVGDDELSSSDDSGVE